MIRQVNSHLNIKFNILVTLNKAGHRRPVIILSITFFLNYILLNTNKKMLQQLKKELVQKEDRCYSCVII